MTRTEHILERRQCVSKVERRKQRQKASNCRHLSMKNRFAHTHPLLPVEIVTRATVLLKLEVKMSEYEYWKDLGASLTRFKLQKKNAEFNDRLSTRGFG